MIYLDPDRLLTDEQKSTAGTVGSIYCRSCGATITLGTAGTAAGTGSSRRPDEQEDER